MMRNRKEKQVVNQVTSGLSLATQLQISCDLDAI